MKPVVLKPPTAQTSLVAIAVRSLRSLASGPGFGVSTTDHAVPSQCSAMLMSPEPNELGVGLWKLPTAHMSVGEMPPMPPMKLFQLRSWSATTRQLVEHTVSGRNAGVGVLVPVTWRRPEKPAFSSSRALPWLAWLPVAGGRRCALAAAGGGALLRLGTTMAAARTRNWRCRGRVG